MWYNTQFFNWNSYIGLLDMQAGLEKEVSEILGLIQFLSRTNLGINDFIALGMNFAFIYDPDVETLAILVD